MIRKRNPPGSSSEIIKRIVEQTKLNLNLQTQLVQWLSQNEEMQCKFRYAVINKISRIESMLSLLLVGQLAQVQGQRPTCTEEKLEEAARTTDEFISEQSAGIGKNILKYLFEEEPKAELHRDRRRKWHGWEI